MKEKEATNMNMEESLHLVREDITEIMKNVKEKVTELRDYMLD